MPIGAPSVPKLCIGALGAQAKAAGSAACEGEINANQEGIWPVVRSLGAPSSQQQRVCVCKPC